MRGSYQSRAGLPGPMLMAAVAAITGATLFGGGAGDYVFPWSGPAPVALGSADAPLAPAAPLQERLPEAARRPVDLGGGYSAAPSHRFAVEAVVLSRHPYRFGAAAAVSPLDLALGWGPMSNPALLAHLDIAQRGRFGHLRAGPGGPVETAGLGRHWANVHLVPAGEAVARQLAGIAEGRVVRLTGALVDVSGPGGFVWRSSTSRTDRGPGACEILLVREVSVLR